VYDTTEPSKPDNVVTLYDSGGEGPDTDDLDPERCAVQVRVRSSSFTEAYDRQRAIRDLLILPSYLESDQFHYSVVTMTTNITTIGRDDKNRYLLTANYLVVREERS
jgi:hypothetical protein